MKQRISIFISLLFFSCGNINELEKEQNKNNEFLTLIDCKNLSINHIKVKQQTNCRLHKIKIKN